MDEMFWETEAAWQRLEDLSGIDRTRWRLGGRDAPAPEAAAMLEREPAVRAAHDQVQRSLVDFLAAATAHVDRLAAETDRLRRDEERRRRDRG